MEGSTQASTNRSFLHSVLLLLGSFAFAFCLGEAVHELGHYLSHRLNGVTVGIRLDPFGGSRIINGSSAPPETWGITTLMGPLFNLICGLLVTLLIWRVRKPALLPFLLWGPLALVQEGVAFSLGQLTPGGDANLLTRFWGVHPALMLSAGILFLVCGVILTGWLLPLVDLSREDGFGRKLLVVMGGMVSFMLIRLVGSSFRSPELLVENLFPLVFALLLAVLVVLSFNLLNPLLNRISTVAATAVTSRDYSIALVLGLGIILVQLVMLN